MTEEVKILREAEKFVEKVAKIPIRKLRNDLNDCFFEADMSKNEFIHLIRKARRIRKKKNRSND